MSAESHPNEFRGFVKRPDASRFEICGARRN